MTTRRKLIILKQQPACPKCGGQMRLVTPKTESDAWRPFYSCQNWQRDGSGCSGTLPVTPYSEAQISFFEKPETQEVWTWA